MIKMFQEQNRCKKKNTERNLCRQALKLVGRFHLICLVIVQTIRSNKEKTFREVENAGWSIYITTLLVKIIRNIFIMHKLKYICHFKYHHTYITWTVKSVVWNPNSKFISNPTMIFYQQLYQYGVKLKEIWASQFCHWNLVLYINAT